MLPTLHQIINIRETADQRAVEELPEKIPELFSFSVIKVFALLRKQTYPFSLSLSSKSEVLKILISKIKIFYTILTESN